MHGLVVLIRLPKQAVTMKLACVGYCAEHREEAVDVTLNAFRGRGQIVTVSAPELVRPSRQVHWRRTTTARLAAGAQRLLASSEAVGEPLPYPVEPVPAADLPPVVRVGDEVDAAPPRTSPRAG